MDIGILFMPARVKNSRIWLIRYFDRIYLGDFNCVISSLERRGGKALRRIKIFENSKLFFKLED